MGRRHDRTGGGGVEGGVHTRNNNCPRHLGSLDWPPTDGGWRETNRSG